MWGQPWQGRVTRQQESSEQGAKDLAEKSLTAMETSREIKSSRQHQSVTKKKGLKAGELASISLPELEIGRKEVALRFY